MKSALSKLGQRTQSPPISWLMDLALSRPHLISLAAGFTDNASLPVDFTRELVDEILRHAKHGQPALQYGPTAGDPMLRELTAKRLTELDARESSRNQSERIAAESIIITHGSQQLLYILTEALCDPGDIVLVEDPTYFVYLGIAQSHGLDCRGVRMEADGIDLDHLEQLLKRLKQSGELKRVKFLYLVSYYQNPACLTTSFEKKEKALALLRQYEKFAGHPIYLLEDAAYRELRFTGADTRSALCARGAEARVLYTGTYSKPFATGVRVGFGVLPEPVLTLATRIKGNHDFGTANLVQQILVKALRTGRYETHLSNLRRRYARKSAVMEKAMEKYFPAGVTWPAIEGGLYFWAKTPTRVKTGIKSRTFQEALNADVFYVPGAFCYANDKSRRKPDNEMRLSFGSASEKNIREGIKRLGSVLHGRS